jgi:two-component sensor histidine kinase
VPPSAAVWHSDEVGASDWARIDVITSMDRNAGEQSSVNTAAISDAAIRPPNLLTARALLQRPKRAPNLQAEAVALCELSKILADDPCVALRRSPEIALSLCNAGTAGLSLLRRNAGGQTTVHWEVVSGALALHEGTDTPRDYSPCGLCLDAGATILVSRPARSFTYLRETRPTIVENLIVPLYDSARKPLGTFWVAHHDSTARFCADDARIVEQLAAQLVLALKLVEQARERRYAFALLESQQLAQRNLLVHDMAEERRLRAQAEASERGIRRTLMFKDAVIHEAHHRVKNTLQLAASLLSVHARAALSADVRLALQASYERLHVLAKVHELLYASADSTQDIIMPALLHAMADALRRAFAQESGRVSLHVTCDPIALSPDDAIPLALLANEVMTNAYKHAFPDGSSGEIIVSLHCAPENAVILQITDNGIGMHPGSDESGLGLTLIRSFAEHLQGTLVVAEPLGVAGTTITLTIHRGAKRPHELDQGESDVGTQGSRS